MTLTVRPPTDWPLRKSRYNFLADDDDGGLIAYNSLTGNVIFAKPDEADTLRRLLSAKLARDPDLQRDQEGTIAVLTERGFLVDQAEDEQQQAQAMRTARVDRDNVLELILMPTEACNFRCTYCYEDFKLGRMLPEVRQGLVRYAAGLAGKLEYLNVSWFGGEPLVAVDVIEDLSRQFQALGREHGFAFSGGMTTNGYLLTPETFEKCVDLDIRRYQITFDGPKRTHDLSRIMMGNLGTFDEIVANLRSIAATDHDVEVVISTNFSAQNVDAVPEFLEEMAELCAGDARFRFLFRPVGMWGGPQDDALPVCFGEEAELAMLGLYGQAASWGLDASNLSSGLQPGSSICYAANPWSLLVRPDGSVGKCTVALREDVNHVGRIHPDGRLELNGELMDLWTNSDEVSDKHCRACYFRPACQGAYCPLKRIQDNQRPCPPHKVQMRRTLITINEIKRIERRRAVAVAS